MINVDMTIVGYFGEVKCIQIVVSDERPTVRNALNALNDTDSGPDSFAFEESVVSNHRGERTLVLNPVFGRTWSFAVLRKSAGKKVLIPNLNNISYDQFRIVDGDQIYWSLVATGRHDMTLNLGSTDQDTPIAV